LNARAIIAWAVTSQSFGSSLEALPEGGSVAASWGRKPGCGRRHRRISLQRQRLSAQTRTSDNVLWIRNDNSLLSYGPWL